MIYIGISGWTYSGWRGKFYPADLPHRRELEFASRAFPSIEINGTHYSLQRPTSFESWRKQTPEDFIFSVKGGRYITHLRRLREIEVPLANFFASGVLALGEKLGPILWQFPPNFRYESTRIEAFLELLPKTTTEAAALARRHDSHLTGRAYTKPGRKRRMRHCVEIRHESFLNANFFAMLRRYGIAFVFADSAGKWPYAEDLTSDFVYIRLHGEKVLYSGHYGKDSLEWWANRIRHWEDGRQTKDAKTVRSSRLAVAGRKDVYLYSDNDQKVCAPRDAKQLIKMLG